MIHRIDKSNQLCSMFHNMKIIEIRTFTRELERFLKKKQLLEIDYKSFKKNLAEYPELGDLISGTNGVRKIRLKSAFGGKSGGFRVCYYYIINKESIYLLFIYSKNAKEDLSMQEKRILRGLVNNLKEENK